MSDKCSWAGGDIKIWGGTNLKCVLAKGTKGSSPQTEKFAKDKKKLTP